MVLVHFNTLEELPAKIKAAQTKVPNFKSILITGMSDGEKTDKIATVLHEDLEQHGVVTVVIPRHMRVEAVRKAKDVERAIDETPSVAEIAHHLNKTGFKDKQIVVFGVNHINLHPLDVQRLDRDDENNQFTYYGYDGSEEQETTVTRLNRTSRRRGSKAQGESDIVVNKINVVDMLKRLDFSPFLPPEKSGAIHSSVFGPFSYLHEQCPTNCSVLIWNTATPAAKQQGFSQTDDIQSLRARRRGKVQFSEMFVNRPKLSNNALNRFLAVKVPVNQQEKIDAKMREIDMRAELSDDEERLLRAKVIDSRAPSLSSRYFLAHYLSSLPRDFKVEKKSVGRLGLVK